jgi:hypothetical protein
MLPGANRPRLDCYTASHSRVAPKNVGLQKEQKNNTFTFIPVMKCGCVFCEFAKRKLATRKDKIKIIKTKREGYATCLPLALSVSREDRCEVLACYHVLVKMYRYSLEERVFIVKTYWNTGSIKNCQKRFVEKFGGQNPPSKRCIQLLVKKLISFRVVNFLFANSQNTQPHFITGMIRKCIVLLFFL